MLRREANVKVAVTFLKGMGINIWPANSAEIQTKHFKFVNVRIHTELLISVDALRSIGEPVY